MSDVTRVLAALVTVLLSCVATHLAPWQGRWWVAGLTTAVLSTWVVLLTEPLESLGFLVLATVWGIATAVDLWEHRLPDQLTLLPIPAFLVLQVPWSVMESEWAHVGWALLGGAVSGAVFFAIGFINPAGFGLGDVKLGMSTGTALGWFGLSTALVGVAAAFFLMALVSLLLLAGRRISRDSEIPFGPFIVAAVLVAPMASTLLGAMA